jgi:hypothetical protein
LPTLALDFITLVPRYILRKRVRRDQPSDRENEH